MKKSPKKNIIAVVVGVAALFLALFGVWYATRPRLAIPPSALVSKPLRIGGVVPLSGNRKTYGVPLQRAAQLAIDEINRKGGINGEQIQIIWEDGKCETAAAKRAAERLINDQKVQFILGGVCSFETLGIASIAEANQVLVFSPASTDPAISRAGEYIFRLTGSDDQAAKVAARIAFNKFKGKRIAVISQRTAVMSKMRQAFVAEIQAQGAEVVFDETFVTGDRNSAALVTQAAKTEPDVVYLLPESTTQGIQQLEQIKKIELKATVLVGEVLLSRVEMAQKAEAYEGVYGLEGYFDKESELTKRFLESYEAQFVEVPEFPYFMSNMYDAVHLVRTGAEIYLTDTTRIQSWLLSLQAWPGAAGDLTFDTNGDALVKYSLLKVSGGKSEIVEVYDAAKH